MARIWDAIEKHQAESPGKSDATKPDRGPTKAHGDTVPGDNGSANIATAMSAAPVIPQANPAPKPAYDANYSEEVVAHHDRGSGWAEEYRSLRNTLISRRRDGRFCHMVTSAEAAEGKTVTCLNLGMVLTEHTDRRTILVDADLRRSRIAKMLRADPKQGLADVLRGEGELADMIQSTAYPNLDLLAAGTVEHDDVGELLSQTQLQIALSELQSRYDYVLVDSPPINRVSDAGSLGRALSEALLVVRMNKTRQESVEKAIRMLHASNIEVAGIVLTHRKYHIPNYLYKYS
jgi:capsular exopolysaccharide synthesis family protein